MPIHRKGGLDWIGESSKPFTPTAFQLRDPLTTRFKAPDLPLPRYEGNISEGLLERDLTSERAQYYNTGMTDEDYYQLSRRQDNERALQDIKNFDWNKFNK